MKLESVKVGKRHYYNVNGKPIGYNALKVIINELFTAGAEQSLWQDLFQSGYVNIRFNETNIQRNEDRNNAEKYYAMLQTANNKIAALEKRVKELTLENLYLTA